MHLRMSTHDAELIFQLIKYMPLCLVWAWREITLPTNDPWFITFCVKTISLSKYAKRLEALTFIDMHASREMAC